MNRGKQLKMFKSPLMEILSYVHPVWPALVFVPVFLWSIQRSLALGLGIGSLGVLILAGIVAWTLNEYTLHRLVFHFPIRGAITKRFHFIVHGVHHDDPNDALRLVMPPIISIPLAVFFYQVFVLIGGAAGGTGFFAGFVVGYLIYDYSHFYFHHGKAKSPLAKYLRRHHLLHHHHDDGRNFGVSTPLWDLFFGTMDRS